MTDRQIINTGTNPNDFTGESIRSALNKCNANFAALWDEKAEVVGRTYAAIGEFNLTPADSSKEYANIDAVAQAVAQLPANPTIGLRYTFLNLNEFGWRIYANGGAKIRLGALLSSADGYLETTTTGDSVTVIAVSATLWFVHPIAQGGWDIH